MNKAASQHTVWPASLDFVPQRGPGADPLHTQLTTRLTAALNSGEIKPGEMLLDEISIGERLGMSRPTVRRAIESLVAQGLLLRTRGVGTQVVQRDIARDIKLTSLHDDLGAGGFSSETRVLAVSSGAATASEAKLLRVDPRTPVTRIRRLRLADGKPLAVMTNTMPPLDGEFTAELLSRHGLYEVLRQRGVEIRVANQSICARRASSEEAELLKIARASPVLTMQRIAFDSQGNVVEVGQHSYNPALYHFATTLVAK